MRNTEHDKVFKPNALKSVNTAHSAHIHAWLSIERLQCHPGKSGGHVFCCLQFCYRMFPICNRLLFTTCNRTRDTKKHGRRSSRDDTATSLYITKYTQLTAVDTNTFLSTLSVQPCMHPHTTRSPLSVYSYALPATDIPIHVAQLETILLIISGSKVFKSQNESSQDRKNRLNSLCMRYNTDLF